MLPRLFGAIALSLALTGCGPLTLAHDSLLGPVSPLGRIHETVTGSGFHVTETGPVAELGDEALPRPYPIDLISRIAEPSSFWSAAQGIEAFLTSISPIASRDTRVGRSDREVVPADLHPGAPVAVVLALLGPPDLWVAREAGSFMVYTGSEKDAWSFYLGVPPPLAALVPIPGIANARFRYGSERERATKLMLFFDEHGAFTAATASSDPAADAE